MKSPVLIVLKYLIAFGISITYLNPIVAQVEQKTPEQILIDSLQNQIEKLRTYNSNEKVYGHALFKSDSIKIFDQSSITKIPEGYIVGRGDEISFTIFGQSQYEGKSLVDENGQISLGDDNRIPKVQVLGLTWAQTKSVISKTLIRYAIFESNQIAITLSNPRTITVNIFGNVNKPGTYNLPATNTAFNAIIAAGGPQANASIRNIKVISNNKQTNLDIYELMNNPSIDARYYLQDNAIIQVPLAKKIIHTEGAFIRPLDYELKDNEGLKDLLNYSGGLKANAIKDFVQIKRYTDTEQILLDTPIKNLKSNDVELMAGDLVIAETIREYIVNQVQIEGAVEIQGKFSLNSTKKISDLINKAKLKREAKQDLAFLYRENENKTIDIIEIDLKSILSDVNSPANIMLEANDNLIIQSSSAEVTKSTVEVKGEVRIPTTIPFDPDSTLTISKALKLAGGLDDQAASIGYLVRENQNNKNEKSYLRIDLQSITNSENADANIRLIANDQIIAYKNSSITDQLYVYTKGAFRRNERLFFDPNLTIQNIIELSSGFKINASRRIDIYRLELKNDVPSRIIVASVTVDENNQIIQGDKNLTVKPNDEFVARVAADIDKQSFVTLEGEVLYPGPYAITQNNETLSDLLNKAGGLTEEAFATGIKLFRSKNKLDSVITNVVISKNNGASANYNILLKANDKIVVPKINDVVNIQLAQTKIYEINPSKYKSGFMGVQFNKTKRANWYIDNFAGGFSSKANKRTVIVEYPNGGIKKTKRFLFFKKYPLVEKGSTIYIQKKERKDPSYEQKNMGISIPKSVKGVVIYENETKLQPIKKNLKINDQPEIEKTSLKVKQVEQVEQVEQENPEN